MTVRILKELRDGASLMESLEQEIEEALKQGVYIDAECQPVCLTLIFYDQQKKIFVLVEEFENKLKITLFDERIALYQAMYPLLNTLSFYPLDTPFIQAELTRLNPHVQSRLF